MVAALPDTWGNDTFDYYCFWNLFVIVFTFNLFESAITLSNIWKWASHENISEPLQDARFKHTEDSLSLYFFQSIVSDFQSAVVRLVSRMVWALKKFWTILSFSDVGNCSRKGGWGLKCRLRSPEIYLCILKVAGHWLTWPGLALKFSLTIRISTTSDGWLVTEMMVTGLLLRIHL